MLVFFDFEKVEKISENFWKCRSIFGKKMAGHKTPNFQNFRKFFLKNGMKNYLWGDIKLQKFWGSPKIYSDFVASGRAVIGNLQGRMSLQDIIESTPE